MPKYLMVSMQNDLEMSFKLAVLPLVSSVISLKPVCIFVTSVHHCDQINDE